jgi:hypothetical protein
LSYTVAATSSTLLTYTTQGKPSASSFFTHTPPTSYINMTASAQTKLEQGLKESQIKCFQVENDLKDEKGKRVQAERDLVWAQRDIKGSLSEVVQLKEDLRKEKRKSAAVQPEHDGNKDNKPKGEPTRTNVVQLLMDDLDEFVSTATGVG